ncbi:acyl-CoA dehydrogenase family protein [Pontiella sp.]|uniref:acyl-CoA dehydrogenase family protein n=1 Tax=Pontiella sp. TaxID=2837462 RepID=UPI0035630DDD
MHETLDRYLGAHFASTPDYSSFDEEFLGDFLKQGPLHRFIPVEYGGSYEGISTCLDLLDTVSYHCLPLGLALGISGSLFLLPMARLASPELNAAILPRFIGSTELGGMMITEPTGGTDIFGLRSTLEVADGRARLNGVKCWGGLTGRAEHWLVAARIKNGDKLTRRVAMAYVPLAAEGVAVENYFDALGLQPIPYGSTRYTNVDLPQSYLITPPGGSALRDILDTLFRSRMGVAAIAAGQCRRLADEVAERAGSRITFGRTIGEYDQVQYRISGLRGLQQINQSLWHFTGHWCDHHTDVSGDHLLANASKVISSEGLQAAADSAVQLFASAAYKRNHVVGRAFTDARPFQIFEGSNDVLLENTYDVLASRYGGVDAEVVETELERYGLKRSDQVPAAVREGLLRNDGLSQRQKVQYGKIISWILVLSVLEREAALEGNPIEDGLRLAHRHLAAHMAELPYLG